MRRITLAAVATALAPAMTQGADGFPASRVGELASPVLVALTILALGAGATAAVLVTHLVLPGLSRRSALLVRRTPVRSLIYGLLAVLIVVLALVLARGISPGLAKLLVALLGIPAVVFGLVGATAVSHSLGESLLAGAGSPHQDSGPWAVAVGAGLLSVVNLLPIVGQVICFVALLTGLGAVVRQTLTRPPPAIAPPPTAP